MAPLIGILIDRSKLPKFAIRASDRLCVEVQNHNWALAASMNIQCFIQASWTLLPLLVSLAFFRRSSSLHFVTIGHHWSATPILQGNSTEEKKFANTDLILLDLSRLYFELLSAQEVILFNKASAAKSGESYSLGVTLLVVNLELILFNPLKKVPMCSPGRRLPNLTDQILWRHLRSSQYQNEFWPTNLSKTKVN